MKQLTKTRLRLASALFLLGGIIFTCGLSDLLGENPRRDAQKTTRRITPPPAAPEATPGSGTLNPGGPNISWVGTGTGVPPSPDESTCVEGVNCDTFTLTLSGTPGDWVGKTARVVISADDPDLSDYDVFIHKGADNSGPLVGSAASGGTPPEVVDLDPNNPAVGTGVFSVHVVYFAATSADQYSGSASVIGGVPTPTPTPTPSPTPVAGTPRFFNYYAPPGVANDAGEPTIGVNWTTENVPHPTGTGTQTFKNQNLDGTENTILNGGTVNYYGGFLAFMLRVTFDDCSSPADALFEEMPLVLAATPRVFGDPLLFTDHLTGRTFVSQLVGLTPAGASIEITDDDGDTFSPSQGAAPSCLDHQTIGGGVFHTPLPPGLIYPNAVYYASQCVSDATSQLSLDGGITFPIQTVMFTALDCAGLHGHIKIAPDGTAYVPDKACASGGVPFVFGGEAAVAVSENNGLTWDVRTIPGATSNAGVDDPSVGVSWCPPDSFACDKAARSNTIYLGFLFEDGRPGIAVSNNKGLDWSTPVDIGALAGVKHAAFPAVVVGDPDRAAFTFFGTTTQGSYDQPEFPGIWHLYVATTFDGGANWTVQNVTPGDPIQRGGICGDGTCRNLLDFFDATIDKQGRILIAGEDGCIDGCVTGGPNSFTAKAFITRQTGGKRMFAVYDAETAEPTRAGAPKVSGGLNAANTEVTLNWPTPDNGGSPITGYNVYRAPAATGPFVTPIATLPGDINTYVDTTFPAGPNYYVVTALNAVGESPYCHPLLAELVDPPTPCDLPYGLLVINDFNADGTDKDSGQNTPVDGSVNVRQLFIGEPFLGAGVNKLVFTLKVAPSLLTSPPPNSQWFIVWNSLPPNDVTHDRWYVGVRTDAAGTPTYEYGKFGPPLPLPPEPPNPDANTPQPQGTSITDPTNISGSYDVASGVIQMTLSASKADDVGRTAGQDLAGLNVRTYFNRLDPGQRSQNNASDITDDSSYTVVGNATCAPVAQLVNAVSRKIHGAAGTFDIKLAPIVPSTSTAIECRRGGASNNFQVVMTFAAPVTFTGASVSPGTGGVASTSGSGTNQATVNLTGVNNAQTITVNLLGVSAGGAPTDIPVRMSALLGDTTADTAVNSADVSQTKSRSGKVVTGDNFRSDVTIDGNLNSADVALVKSKSGTALPP
ncbi:MAG: hypothetical protein H0V54_03835 [Chthoniobacterales bacterium]|nr:hypothetical protein [Chthoniobacterales bacterium]